MDYQNSLAPQKPKYVYEIFQPSSQQSLPTMSSQKPQHALRTYHLPPTTSCPRQHSKEVQREMPKCTLSGSTNRKCAPLTTLSRPQEALQASPNPPLPTLPNCPQAHSQVVRARFPPPSQPSLGPERPSKLPLTRPLLCSSTTLKRNHRRYKKNSHPPHNPLPAPKGPPSFP